MLDYKKEYRRWLTSDALSTEEKAELQAISGDEKEIESRFYGPLEFGTAGLRGTMKVGLHQMNLHVICWATQGFADVIAAEGEEAKKKGVAICMDCRVNSMAFARAALLIIILKAGDAVGRQQGDDGAGIGGGVKGLFQQDGLLVLSRRVLGPGRDVRPAGKAPV